MKMQQMRHQTVACMPIFPPALPLQFLIGWTRAVLHGADSKVLKVPIIMHRACLLHKLMAASRKAREQLFFFAVSTTLPKCTHIQLMLTVDSII